MRNDGCFPELKAKIRLQNRNKTPNLVGGPGSCHSQQALKYLCRFQKWVGWGGVGGENKKPPHTLMTSWVAFDSPDRVKKKEAGNTFVSAADGRLPLHTDTPDRKQAPPVTQIKRHQNAGINVQQRQRGVRAPNRSGASIKS